MCGMDRSGDLRMWKRLQRGGSFANFVKGGGNFYFHRIQAFSDSQLQAEGSPTSWTLDSGDCSNPGAQAEFFGFLLLILADLVAGMLIPASELESSHVWERITTYSIIICNVYSMSIESIDFHRVEQRFMNERASACKQLDYAMSSAGNLLWVPPSNSFPLYLWLSLTLHVSASLFAKCIAQGMHWTQWRQSFLFTGGRYGQLSSDFQHSASGLLG